MAERMTDMFGTTLSSEGVQEARNDDNDMMICEWFNIQSGGGLRHLQWEGTCCSSKTIPEPGCLIAELGDPVRRVIEALHLRRVSRVDIPLFAAVGGRADI